MPRPVDRRTPSWSSACAPTRPARRCARSTATTAASSTASRSTRSATAARRRRSCRRSSCAPGATPGATTPTRAACARGSTRSPATRSSTRAGAPPCGPACRRTSRRRGGAAARSLEQAMLGWQVAAALERLTPEHRQMIRMAQFRGLTMREIAERTGLPLGTVKSRTWYALRSLRLVLEEMGVVPHDRLRARPRGARRLRARRARARRARRRRRAPRDCPDCAARARRAGGLPGAARPRRGLEIPAAPPGGRGAAARPVARERARRAAAPAAGRPRLAPGWRARPGGRGARRAAPRGARRGRHRDRDSGDAAAASRRSYEVVLQRHAAAPGARRLVEPGRGGTERPHVGQGAAARRRRRLRGPLRAAPAGARARARSAPTRAGGRTSCSRPRRGIGEYERIRVVRRDPADDRRPDRE